MSLEQGEHAGPAGARGDDGPVDQTARFVKYIEWRRRDPSDDLMTELLNARLVDETGVERTLRDDELLGYIALIAGAGNETTTRLIGWTAYLLDRFPDQRRRLAADRSLVPNAIEEILRYEAPSPVQARYVTRDVEWHGTRVPEGSALLLLNGSANRDEREREFADRLDVGRRNTHHLSFGYGIHTSVSARASLASRAASPSKRFWRAGPSGRSITSVPRWHVPRPCAVGRRCPLSCSRGERLRAKRDARDERRLTNAYPRLAASATHAHTARDRCQPLRRRPHAIPGEDRRSSHNSSRHIGEEVDDAHPPIRMKVQMGPAGSATACVRPYPAPRAFAVEPQAGAVNNDSRAATHHS